MDPMTIISLIQAVIPLVSHIPELVTALGTAVNLITSGMAPTAEQQAQIDAALDAANKAVMGA